MKLKVLGCSGAEFPGHNTSAFLIDDTILLDAGTVGAVLSEDDQLGLTDILITHTHIDHIKGIPLLADNITIRQIARNIKIISTSEILETIRQHLMNDVIWPDFSKIKIPSASSPVVSYLEIEPGLPFTVGEYTITALPMSHSVPAVGFILRSGETSLLYTGDTGPTARIWQDCGALSALVIEVSFPDALEEMASLTGHLTPKLLAVELRKLDHPPRRILVTHLKPQFIDTITAELKALNISGLEILFDGALFDI